MAATITLGALNRATLARQLLLARAKISTVKAVEQLAGLQAQLARPPFIGLWSRIADFSRADLLDAISRREIVRATLMRATLHLFSARDLLALRASLQPALDRAMKSALRERARTGDFEELLADGRSFFATPRTFDELRERLEKQKAKDIRADAYTLRCILPLVQVASDDEFGYSSAGSFVTVEKWLGKGVAADPAPGKIVLRYLAAFGPASVADAQAWSGLPSLRETFEALRGKLAVFRDARGRELFDLPDAPRPPEKSPAPPRLLPEFDNLVLAHDDRTRIVDDEHRGQVVTKNLQVRAVFLVDGRAAGVWKIERGKGVAKLSLSPWEGIGKNAKGPLTDEANALLRFAEPDAKKHEVTIG
jgi:hypothetical protein